MNEKLAAFMKCFPDNDKRDISRKMQNLIEAGNIYVAEDGRTVCYDTQRENVGVLRFREARGTDIEYVGSLKVDSVNANQATITLEVMARLLSTDEKPMTKKDTENLPAKIVTVAGMIAGFLFM